MRTLLVCMAMMAALLGTAHAAAIVIPTPECSAIFETSPSGELLRAPGCGSIGTPGDPALPFRDVHVLLPPNVDARSVSVELSGATVSFADTRHDLTPAPPIVTVVDGQEVLDWGENKQISNGRNTLVYGSDECFPRSNVEIRDVGSMRKWRIARIRFYPCRYRPQSGLVEFASGGEIRVTYRTMAQVMSLSATRDELLSDAVAGLAANFSDAQAWYGVSKTLMGVQAQEETQATIGYTIITTAAVVAGSSKLQSFVNHKTSRGFTVSVVTEAQWGGGTGDTAANNLRNYLKANYISKSMKYVLLIGDPNPTTGTVPMKMLWPRRSSTSYREAPSDYFYADLTGNWDLDGDGYYGEGDHDLASGGCDRYPEVIVGRIPFYGNFTDLNSILQKTIDYESGVIGGNWIRKAVLSAKPSDASTPGYTLCEAIKKDALDPIGFGSIRVYEQAYGLTPAPDYVPCSYDNVTSAWQQHAGFHFWWTHGNETIAADIFTSDRTQYLDNNYPSFTFQCSCLNGYPENSNNLGYALLKRGAIATDTATRVSWYYPGQLDYTNTDSNAGMTYRYAVKLVRDHLPCGDAHYQMMTEVPLDIWMNHCVFNLYGDPSVSYAAGPAIVHTPHGDTDVTNSAYVIDAQVVANGALKAGSPVIRWNTNGGTSFSSAAMSLLSGSTYRGQIPQQPYGTTIYYYLYAEDTASRNGVSPAGAPDTLYSFKVRVDNEPPVIVHTPLANTGDTAGPYTIAATITDNTGIGSATLYYHKNAASDTALTMTSLGGNQYQALIPGPTVAGDTVSYYIVAADSSLNHNTARSPSLSGYNAFSIPAKRRVAIYNCASTPPCFIGSNSNVYQSIADVLTADPAQRFAVTIITSLTSTTLGNQDALVFPDNGPLSGESQAVLNWFIAGKTIVTLESSTSYASCSALLWPQSTGVNGFGTYWDTNASVNDQEIVLQDPITSGYTLGQVIDSRGYTAEFITSTLPADAKVLARSKYNPGLAYAVYRDVPSKGRIVALGPYVQLLQSQYSMLREALAVSPLDRIISIIAPASGASFETGDTVNIQLQTSGAWSGTDRIKLEYNTGLDSTWRQIAGALTLLPGSPTFAWNTQGLPGSETYKIRASATAGTPTSATSGAFAIVPVVGIAQAKSMPDGTSVKLKSKVVTYSASGLCYVQEPNRMAGLRVESTAGLSLSALATLVGKMATTSGERVLEASSAQVLSTSSTTPPLATKTSSVGGGAFGLQQPVMEYKGISSVGVWSTILVPATGLSNIGLLVKVAGKVTALGSDYFYVDDGSGCNDGSGMVGVRVLCGALTKPSSGAIVAVSAVSSTYYERGCMWRALVLPSQSSLQVLR